MTMDITLKTEAEFRDHLPPQTQAEWSQLLLNIQKYEATFPPIITWKGYKDDTVIIDGHHQYKARKKLGLPIRYKALPFENKDDVLEFMESVQRARRNASDSQLAMVAAKRVTTTGRGRPARGENTPVGGITTAADAAVAVGVSERSVSRAAAVHRKGSTKLVEAVEAGEVSVSEAEKVLELPKPEQLPALKKKAAKAKVERKAVQKKRASGAETVSSADRKLGVQLVSKLVRVVDKLKIEKLCREPLKLVLKAIREA